MFSKTLDGPSWHLIYQNAHDILERAITQKFDFNALQALQHNNKTYICKWAICANKYGRASG